jgi:predicted dehydrogenase
LPSAGVEPLRAELEAFLEAVCTRKEPKTNGTAGRAALELATRITACIQEHAARVQLIGGHPAADLPAFHHPRKDEK